jgi:hypothetical protein
MRSAESNFPNLVSMAKHITDKRLTYVDSREWKQDWGDRWVAYADLIAFAARTKRSEQVVLNNIVRFDRATRLVASQFPRVRVFRFSDSTFAVADDFHSALAFAVAISQTCLAFNLSYLDRGTKRYFIHLIVPRVTIARGRVLLVSGDQAAQRRYGEINRDNVVAGSGVVNAYNLEKQSAGGLVTFHSDAIAELRTLRVRGSPGRVRNGLKRWSAVVADQQAVSAGQVLCVRNDFVDVPWRRRRPIQNDRAARWTASGSDADTAIRTFLDVWQLAEQEYYSPQACGTPLDVSKHRSAAVRFAIHCFQMSHGQSKPKYLDVTDVLERLS